MAKEKSGSQTAKKKAERKTARRSRRGGPRFGVKARTWAKSPQEGLLLIMLTLGLIVIVE